MGWGGSRVSRGEEVLSRGGGPGTRLALTPQAWHVALATWGQRLFHSWTWSCMLHNSRSLQGLLTMQGQEGLALQTQGWHPVPGQHCAIGLEGPSLCAGLATPELSQVGQQGPECMVMRAGPAGWAPSKVVSALK